MIVERVAATRAVDGAGWRLAAVRPSDAEDAPLRSLDDDGRRAADGGS